MDKKKYQFVVVSIFIILMCIISVCAITNWFRGSSPKDVIRSYYDAKDRGDIEFLRQIIFFPQSTTEEEINSRIKSEITGTDEKILTRAVGAKIKVEYEKIIDDQTAEVGVVLKMGLPCFKKRVPFQEIVLKKDDNKWKYSFSKYELSEKQLIEAIKENPYDASAIFHLGRLYQPDNPAKANKYYVKYRELEPQGFWISKELLDQIKKYQKIENEESELLKKLKNTPERSIRRASVYLTLGQLFTEHGDYKKADMYLEQAEKVASSLTSHNSDIEKRLKVAQETFDLAVKGEHLDILSELEAKGAYK